MKAPNEMRSSTYGAIDLMTKDMLATAATPIETGMLTKSGQRQFPLQNADMEMQTVHEGVAEWEIEEDTS